MEPGGGATGVTSAPSTPSTTVETALPPPPPYVVPPGEVAPEVKSMAARIVQVLSTYSVEKSGPDDAGVRLAADGLDSALAAQAGALLVADTASSGEIVYPQLGGLTATDASVMVCSASACSPTARSAG